MIEPLGKPGIAFYLCNQTKRTPMVQTDAVQKRSRTGPEPWDRPVSSSWPCQLSTKAPSTSTLSLSKSFLPYFSWLGLHLFSWAVETFNPQRQREREKERKRLPNWPPICLKLVPGQRACSCQPAPAEDWTQTAPHHRPTQTG